MRPRAVVIPIGPSIAYVPLTCGQYALIDSIWAPKVGLYNWRAMWNPRGRAYYAGGYIRGQRIYLHNFLMGPRPEGLQCDHKNRTPLDNRICNIHWVTAAENVANQRPSQRAKSGHCGVTKKGNRYVARYGSAPRRYLGLFPTAHAAAAAVDEAKKKVLASRQPLVQ